ncbi:MAG TPA: hypothetical protein VHQ90_21140 [Thermoanaerobaculia bacterium]|nr:hypothetical protein [Thermoanaerobaculia bacterium]
MAFTFANNPPVEGPALVGQNLQGLAALPPEWRADEIHITDPPMEIFEAGVEDAAANRVLSKAAPNGWRYLLLRGEVPVADAEVDTFGGVVGFRSSSTGRYLAETISVLQRAEALPELAGADFEVRFLRVFGLSFAALWFHREAPEQDFVLPLTSNETLERGAAYLGGEFAERIAVLAKRFLSGRLMP